MQKTRRGASGGAVEDDCERVEAAEGQHIHLKPRFGVGRWGSVAPRRKKSAVKGLGKLTFAFLLLPPSCILPPPPAQDRAGGATRRGAGAAGGIRAGVSGRE